MLACSLALLLSVTSNNIEAFPSQKNNQKYIEDKSIEEVCYYSKQFPSHQQFIYNNQYPLNKQLPYYQQCYYYQQNDGYPDFGPLLLDGQNNDIEDEKEIVLSREVISIKKIIDDGMSKWVFWNGKWRPKAIKILDVKTSFYYTAIEGDTPHHPSFSNAVKIEGSGFGYREGKLTYFYSYDGKTIHQEPYSESKKRGVGADDSQGTLDIGFIAVPREIYDLYKNKICWLRCNDGRYVKVKIKDVGSAIRKRGDYYDVDLYIGTGGSCIYTLGGIGADMFYDKWDEMYASKKERKKFVTRLFITDDKT